MHVSYAEFARLAPEVLRMLGFPFGHADDAVECLLYSQAACGAGYTLVDATDNRQSEYWDLPGLSESDGQIVVDMHGLPLLLYAARLADFASARAVGDATVRLEARGGFGGWVVPYIAYRLARTRVGVSIFWNPPCQMDAREAPPTVCFASPPPDASEPVYVLISPVDPYNASPASDGESIPVPKLCKGGIPFGDRGSETSTLTIITAVDHTPINSGPHADILERASEIGVPEFGVLSMDARFRTFIGNGIEVNEADHTKFVQIADRIRVPSSERSRNHAG